MTFGFRLEVAVLLGLLVAPATVHAQQELPVPLQAGAKSDVPVATQIMRWHMNDGDVNSFAFRNMDQLFTTRTVAHSGAPWRFPKVERPMDFTYSFGGTTYSAEQALERTYTNALLVLKDGRIVSEIYRNGSNEHTRFMGWSMTKSITSILVGAALEDGLISSIDDDITRYLPELKGGGYEGVTIRQILQMRSGVDYEESYDFAKPGIAASNHINALVKNVVRFADVARTIRRRSKPGEVFAYKTIDTAVLGWLIERVSRGSVAAYTARKLWEPLGAEADGFYIMDGQPGTGREFSGAGFNATLRDWGRFGQMMLDGGMANGKHVVSEQWVKAGQTPAGEREGPEGGYGYQWWTMAKSPAYSAIGLQGQYVYIDPASRTVVVKLSYFPPTGGQVMQETLAFLAAASAWQPAKLRCAESGRCLMAGSAPLNLLCWLSVAMPPFRYALVANTAYRSRQAATSSFKCAGAAAPDMTRVATSFSGCISIFLAPSVNQTGTNRSQSLSRMDRAMPFSMASLPGSRRTNMDTPSKQFRGWRTKSSDTKMPDRSGRASSGMSAILRQAQNQVRQICGRTA